MAKNLNAVLDIFVEDRNGQPIPQAKVELFANGKPKGGGFTSGAKNQGVRFQLTESYPVVEVHASFRGQTLLERIDPSQTRAYTFTFEEVALTHAEGKPPVPSWFPIAGYLAGLLTLLFFMYLTLFGDGKANFASIVVLALGAALSFSFIGGKAAAEGKIPLFKDTPLAFTVGGGISVFVIVLIVSSQLFLNGISNGPSTGVNMTFAQHRALSDVISDLENSYNVTVTITNCTPDFTKTLVSAGQHTGKDPKDFLDNLQQRLRNHTVSYTVSATGRRYEIKCTPGSGTTSAVAPSDLELTLNGVAQLDKSVTLAIGKVPADYSTSLVLASKNLSTRTLNAAVHTATKNLTVAWDNGRTDTVIPPNEVRQLRLDINVKSQDVSKLFIRDDQTTLKEITVSSDVVPATTSLENRSRDKPSGPGKDFSPPYSLCLGRAPEGYTLMRESVKFWLTGDRQCNRWATCEPVKVDDSDVCYAFSLQGHEEGPGDGIRYSDGHLKADYRLVPGVPRLLTTSQK